MSEWTTLINDPRTWRAIDKLFDYELCEDLVFNLLQFIAGLPEMWQCLDEETPKKRETRRHDLVHKIRRLAIELDQDPDARHYKICPIDNEISLTTSNILGSLKITDFLNSFSENIENDYHHRGRFDSFLPEKKNTTELDQFVRRQIAFTLRDILPPPEKRKKKTNPIAAAVLLASAILKLDKENEVTPDQMSKAFKNLPTNQKKEG